MWLCPRTVAVDYCCCDYVWIVWICTANGDGLALKIDVTVPRPHVRPFSHDNRPSFQCMINGILNSWEVVWNVQGLATHK